MYSRITEKSIKLFLVEYIFKAQSFRLPVKAFLQLFQFLHMRLRRYGPCEYYPLYQSGIGPARNDSDTPSMWRSRYPGPLDNESCTVAARALRLRSVSHTQIQGYAPRSQ